MIVLIPAYQPTHRLVDLLAGLAERAPWLNVVVVDDGSGPDYAEVFAAAAALGADVIGYRSNLGKGSALKYGFAHVIDHYPGENVVCADSDGQHQLVDILRVAAAITEDTMVLGVRAFSGSVPVRSRLGNRITQGLFGLVTGTPVSDTQTGLRGYPASLLRWLLTVPGTRFEYELNLLLQAKPSGHRIAEVPIATIYLEGNASSHFRPLVDSARIYLPLLRYAGSSLGAFVIDFIALLLFQSLTGNLLAAVIGARGLSSAFNFVTNRHVVFAEAKGQPLGRAVTRYYLLVAVMLAANYGLLTALTQLGVGLALAKLATELALFFAGYRLQREFVFGSADGTDSQVASLTPISSPSAVTSAPAQ